MTDVSDPGSSLPSRLGVTARLDDGSLVLELTPQPQTLHHGVIRASVLSFLVDAVGGIPMDQDPDMWTFTTDMSVRMRPVPAPRRIDAVNTILRQGRRSATCQVELTTEDGTSIATGAIGFVSVPRKATDPPKPVLSPRRAPVVFHTMPSLARPLREEAGIEVIDPAEGVVQVEVTAELRNHAGTLQGAMVALLAESAAEDLIATRFASPVVIVDLDLRYLRKTHLGPVRTRSRLLGTRPDAPVEIELFDTSTGELTTLVYARAVSVG